MVIVFFVLLLIMLVVPILLYMRIKNMDQMIIQKNKPRKRVYAAKHSGWTCLRGRRYTWIQPVEILHLHSYGPGFPDSHSCGVLLRFP